MHSIKSRTSDFSRASTFSGRISGSPAKSGVSLLEAEDELLGAEFEFEMSDEEYEIGTRTSQTMRTGSDPFPVFPLNEDFFDVRSVLLTGSSSEDTIEMIETYKQPLLEPQENFFEKLGSVPDIQQISSDSLKMSQPKVESSLRGAFVDPLTGFEVKSDESDVLPDEIIIAKENIGEILSDKMDMNDGAPYEEFSFDDFDSRFPDVVEKSIEKCKADDDVATLFAAHMPDHDLNLQPFPIRVQAKVVDAAEQTEKFLHDLIAVVVRYCEYDETNQLVRQKLDKKALFAEIKKIVFEVQVEKKVNDFLNKKCAEFHRRKGNVRYQQEDKSEKTQQDALIYKEKCDYLNNLLGRESAMERKIFKKQSQLLLEVDKGSEKKRAEIFAFENLVRKTLNRHLNPEFEKLINNQLRNISTLREEISTVRSLIIQRQHTLGTLRARLRKLEDIGDGLRLADYESLQREMQAVGKKIEDRNRELGKSHGRFHHNLHSMAHIKLKNEVTIVNISEKHRSLLELEVEEHLTRQRLYELNMTHKKIRRQLKDLSVKSGLLDKPALLRDYDETVELVKKRRLRVDELKQMLYESEAKLKLNLPAAAYNSSNVDKSKSLKCEFAAKSIVGLEGICLNF